MSGTAHVELIKQTYQSNNIPVPEQARWKGHRHAVVSTGSQKTEFLGSGLGEKNHSTVTGCCACVN